MNVLMLPDYGGSNPYQELLTRSLVERGITVQRARATGRRPLASAVSEHGLPDVVHLHWQHRFFVPTGGGPFRAVLQTLLFFRDLNRLRRSGVRFVWTVHNVVNHERRYERWERFACRRLARKVDEMTVHCRAARRTVAEAYGVDARDITVIEHPHYREWYPEGIDRIEARERLRLPKSGRIFLHFGLIRPYKGIEDLLDAFSRLDEEDVHLVIVGRAASPRLAGLISRHCQEDPRVRCELEYADDQRLVTYLSAADAVVLPYERLLTSGSAVLAASLGRAVVAPRLGCLKDVPDDAIVAYEQDESDGLHGALHTALDRDLEAVGRRARERVERVSWSEVATRIEYLYHAGGRSSEPMSAAPASSSR